MKRIAIVLIVGLASVAAVSAQGFGMWNAPAASQPVQELTKIEGKLTLVQGHPAVVSGGKTYMVRIPGMMYGYLDALKEGAAVKLEGYALAVPLAADTFFFQTTKLNVGGKDYDLSAYASNGMAGGMMGGRGQRGGRGRW